MILMLALDVSRQLILAIVFEVAICDGTMIRLELDMSSLVIIAISDGGELFLTKLAFVWTLARVDSLMHLEVAALVED